MTVSTKSARVIFFQVKTGQDKMIRLVQVAEEHFSQKKPLLILSPNKKASLYVDSLLWTYPKESFLPHATTYESSQEIICITEGPCRPNGAKHVFNLTSEAVIDSLFTVIYDFDELGDPQKIAVSSEKLSRYKESQISIASF